MVDTFSLSVRLAGMLLLQNGQITVGEIEALPFVSDRQEARAIAQRLARAFGRHYRIEVPTGPGTVDTEIRLVSDAVSSESREISRTV